MSIKSYRDLIAWQKAMDLAVAVFRMTAQLPRREASGLAGQMRRAAVSVPSNIAAGQSSGVTTEYVRLLRLARGSVHKLETQIALAQRLGFIKPEPHDRFLTDAAEVSRVISVLLRALGD